MKFGFTSRISIMLATILVAGLAMTTGLSLDKFRRTHTDLLTSRFQFVVNDIRHRIETQMDLGLALNTLQDVSEELAAYQNNDDSILSIEVFDESGAVLFSTDPSFIGDLVSENWVFLWRTNKSSQMWSTLEKDAGVVGVSIQNNLNQNVGSLALRYSRDILDASVAKQIERLLAVGLIVAVVMAMISLMGCVYLLHSTIDDLKKMTQAMKDIMNKKKDSAELKETVQNHPDFGTFSASAHDLQSNLDDAHLEVIKLDEAETES